MLHVLITGANRGLGLEFARQYKEAGWDVVATARQSSPELEALSVRVETLDMQDLDAVGRFGDRLDITVNVQGDIENNCIAPLLLLPFLENSIKHGASEMIDQAWISMDLDVQGSLLKFKVINGKSDATAPDSSHVGLVNVKKRLELLYPQAHELRITEDADTFVVGLTLQLAGIKIPDA